MKKINALTQGLGALALASGLLLAPQAWANTGGGATIHNFATLTYTGNATGIKAAVNVTVQTLASKPTMTAPTLAQTVPSYGTADYTFTVTSTANGADTFALNAASVDSNTTGAPGISFLQGASVVTSLSLGGSVTSAASGNNTLSIPAGSQTNLAVGDTIVVGGNAYTINSVTAGTVASTDTGTGVSTPEVPTVLALTPVGAAPAITPGSVPVGSLVSEQVVLTQRVVASAPSSSSVTATHTVNFTATSSATNLSGNTVVYDSSVDGGTTVTTVILASNSLVKLVRNVSRAAANSAATGPVSCGTNTYYAAGVVSKPGEELEYCLRASVATGQPALSNAVLQDEVPPFTTYVGSSTTLNAAAVTDPAPNTLPLAGAGLSVKSPGGAAGQILPGETAVVIFKVTVQ